MQISCHEIEQEPFSRVTPRLSPFQHTFLMNRLTCYSPLTTIGHHLFGGTYAVIFGGTPSSFHPQGVQSRLEPLHSFTRSFGLHSSPLTAEKVTRFVAYLGSQGLSISTIQSYMAALRHFQVLANPASQAPFFYSLHMAVLLRGIKRYQAQQNPKKHSTTHHSPTKP